MYRASSAYRESRLARPGRDRGNAVAWDDILATEHIRAAAPVRRADAP
jgi:hypothetical protein